MRTPTVRHAPARGFLPRTRTTWAEFRARYFDEAVAFMKASSRKKVATVFGMIEDLVRPRLLSDLDARRISCWAADRRHQGVSDATIKGNLAVLQAALRWGVAQGFLTECPKIAKPKRARSQKLMKGRPVTEAEYQAMLAKCDDPRLRFLITGLWTSGLRLSEAIGLSWDLDCPDCLVVDFSGKYPMFRVPADADKGNQDRLLPMAPEFAQMLQDAPESTRHGRVFDSSSRCLEVVSAAISAIGEAAGVVVDAKSGKYASAHDLRRSFGERWAMRVMPAVLMQLMRHESIETTMRYYVGQNAQAVAQAVWSATAR